MNGFLELRACAQAFGFFAAVCVLPPRVAAEPVLHEYVPNVDPREASALVVSERGAAVGGAASDGEAGPAYEATAGDGSPGEPPGRRSPSFRPDRLTELASGLDYYEVFRPSIAPFKRVTSLGRVHLDVDGTTPVLGVRGNPRTLVRVEGEDSRPPDARPRDRFVAEVRLDFREGPVVPLPSVSPESRILRLRATPPLPLRIERDADDNFALRLLAPVPDGPVEVEFLTDAPRSYFGAEIPNARVDVLAAEVAPLEPSIETRALAMAKRMRLSRKSDLRTALETLTEYFRSFEESRTPPENTGDLYLDLVRSKKGICRHRAYGFVVTAQALGIPARFVQNEAHSWAEVKLPRIGFMRIDLGGAANGLTAHNAGDGPSYVPSQPDPLPQPASYRRSYAQAAQRARGPAPSAEALAGRWLSPGSVQKDTNPMAANGQATARSVLGAATSGSPPAADVPDAPDSPSPLAAALARASAPRDQRPPRKPVVIQLHQRAPTALRGTELALSGRVVDETSQGVAGLRVEVWIASRERDERMLLGVCVSDETGEFRAALGVPPDLQVGDYRLLVLTPGDLRYSAALAP